MQTNANKDDPFLSDRPVVPPGRPLIEVEDLHKSFGSLHVLRGITTTILKGEVVVVIGPSGGGKSTFLRCLNLLETPTSGRIWFGGEEIVSGGSLQRDGTDRGLSHRARERNLNRYRSDMGMVFQRFNLFPHMTVMDNITLAPKMIRGVSREAAERKAMELLARVGLPDKAKSYPEQLSGGQMQRIAIARALAMEGRRPHPLPRGRQHPRGGNARRALRRPEERPHARLPRQGPRQVARRAPGEAPGAIAARRGSCGRNSASRSSRRSARAASAPRPRAPRRGAG